MALIQIAHKKAECIGCALCTELAPEYWTLDDYGEAQLTSVIRQDAQFQYAEGLPQDQGYLEAAEAGCPVKIIRLS